MAVWKLDPRVRAQFDPVLRAIRTERASFTKMPGFIAVRPGYRYVRPPQPAVVVSVWPGKLAEAEPRALDLGERLGIPVTAVAASPEEQLRAAPGVPSFGPPRPSDLERMLSDEPAPVEFREPRVGSYQPPANLKLQPVDAEMALTACASPEAGWAVLEPFLRGVKESLTVAMYQFTAPHVYDAIRETLSERKAKMSLALHPVPESIQARGVKAKDLPEPQIVEGLQQSLGDGFDYAWTRVGKDGTFGSAYHIKVAVADSNRFWLSSGNWQSSNQPAVNPLAGEKVPPQFQRKYNRDYHVVIDHPALARVFQDYIRYDLTVAREGAPGEDRRPDLIVPDLPPQPPEFAPPRYFEPLRVQGRPVRVQPVLTPDNYADVVRKLIDGAEQSVFFQNQYINLNSDEDLPQFHALVQALLAKQKKGLDVRVICRDLMASDKLDMLTAIGFDPDRFRFQPACHCKAIIVDGKHVLLGSHNWSNEGTVSNRDASLLFDDEEIAGYFEQIYQYDWKTLATAGPASPRTRQPRIAAAGEQPPPGFSRLPWSAVYED